MTGIQRSTLPQEFYDRTSERLLIAPEPQYLHARLIMGAISMDLDMKSGLGAPIRGRDPLPSGQADYLTLDQMRYDLSDPIAAEAITVEQDFMKSNQPGHIIRFNRPKFANTTYTFASRTLPAGGQISSTPIHVGADQVPLTIQRFVGPFDPAQGVPAPIQVSRFDAERAVHSLAKIADLHFTRDFHRTIDSFGVALFDSVQAGNVIYPQGMTQDNDAVLAGDHPFDFETLLRTQKRLDDLGIPRFADGTRLLILTTQQALDLSRDPEYQRQAVFTDRMNPILVGSYIGRCAGFRICQSITLTQKLNASSIAIQYGQAFGPGMVGVGPGNMPHVSPNDNTNYGEDIMAVWIFYCAFGVLDDSFGCSVRSS